MNYPALTKEECAELLTKIENPIIVMHARPDADTCGTAMALATVFEQLGKKAELTCADPISDRLKFIFGDKELTEYKEGMTAVSVDVASVPQLGGLDKSIPSFALMIDHHSSGAPFAKNYIIPDCSSASEALFDVIEVLIERGLVTLTPTLATHLYTAISSDTGCFCFSSATPKTYRLAARLMEVGIDYAGINHKLFNSKSLSQIKAESFVAQKLTLVENGRIAYATISKAERDGLGLPFMLFETAVDVVRSVLGAEISFVMKETDSGQYRASIRSVKKSVSEVAALFGGGGHSLAAGCTPDGNSIEEATEKLLSELRRLL